MKVLMLLPQFPFPSDQGAKMRNAAFVQMLARKHELHLLCFSDHQLSDDQLRPASDLAGSVQVVPTPTRGKLRRVRQQLTSTLPDLAFRYWDRSYASAVAQTLASGSFDVVHVSNLELAPYLRLAEREQRVFDDHNAEYVLQRRAYEMERQDGAFGLSAGYSLLQWRRLRRFESWACRRSHLVLAVSDADAAHLCRLDPSIQPVVVPNGVDVQAYQPTPLPKDLRPFLLFSGKLDYRPNADALHWFTRRVLPRIWEKRPDVRLVALGPQPPEWLVELGKHDARIWVAGPRADDRPYLERSSVYVLPMRWGGGVRFKALVAMAAGRPLVTTNLGIEGVGCEPERDALVANRADDFAASVLRVLDEPHLAARLARAGRKLVEERFAWASIEPTLLAAYDQLSTTKGRS